MGSPNIYRHNPGFTLIELVLTLAISSLLSTSIVSVSLNSMQKYFFTADVATIIRLLETARAQALSNSGGNVHGVRVENNAVILFFNDPYNSSSMSNIKLNTGTRTVSNSPYEVQFEPFSGKTIAPLLLNLTNGQSNATISISTNGVINP